MKDVYNDAVLRFLRNNEALLSVKFKGREENPLWKDGVKRNHYRVSLSNPRGKMSFPFWDSIANTEAHRKPTAYDVLSCLGMYDPGTFEEFCAEYGFDTDSRRAERTWRLESAIYRQLSTLFTQQQIDSMIALFS